MAKSKSTAPSATALSAEQAKLRAAVAAAKSRLADIVLAEEDTAPTRAAIKRDEIRLREIDVALRDLADAIRDEVEAKVDREFTAIRDRIVSGIAAKLAALQPSAAPQKESL